MQPDPTSQSNFLDIATEHVAFDWNIDFDERQIWGSALHTLKASKDGVNEVVCVLNSPTS
jgi:leukotriene-A4 hydrolase